MERLVELGSLTSQMCDFLRVCVKFRKNILVSGGTGSGKTTFLNALSESIPGSERIVTIEDAAELRLVQPHVLSLEARPPNVEGRGEITIRDLVRNALRMRPDRIIVGECRGGEALDMLQAMNTGHDGSMTTGHANSPRDLLSRLEVMVLMAGMDLPVRAIREQISSAVDIIVQQTRFSDGRRRVTSIVEVDGMEGDVILTQPLFAFKQQGIGSSGEIVGEYRGFGQAPRFYEALNESGIQLDRSIFGTASSMKRATA
jgi:pilus assembly protein CpaF